MYRHASRHQEQVRRLATNRRFTASWTAICVAGAALAEILLRAH